MSDHSSDNSRIRLVLSTLKGDVSLELIQDRQAELIRFMQAIIRHSGFSAHEAEITAAVSRLVKKSGYATVEADRWGNVISTHLGVMIVR